ncbi:hypothetical protein CR513_13877, partial [Mucuna pruriens]
MVKRALSRGAFIFANPEGHELTHPVNVDTVKLRNPKDQTLSFQNGGVNTVQHEGNHYQPSIEGVRPEVGPDLYPIPWDTPRGTHTGKGNTSASPRIRQPCHRTTMKSMQAKSKSWPHLVTELPREVNTS